MITFTPSPHPPTSWRRLKKAQMSDLCGIEMVTLQDWFEAGELEIHEIRVDGFLVGHLVLRFLVYANVSALCVFWAEIRPVRAMRGAKDWLEEAVPYLDAVARSQGCDRLIANWSVVRGSRHWLERLVHVGFAPTLMELVRPVEEAQQWVA